jgi:hypothetical protein
MKRENTESNDYSEVREVVMKSKRWSISKLWMKNGYKSGQDEDQI